MAAAALVAGVVIGVFVVWAHAAGPAAPRAKNNSNPCLMVRLNVKW